MTPVIVMWRCARDGAPIGTWDGYTVYPAHDSPLQPVVGDVGDTPIPYECESVISHSRRSRAFARVLRRVEQPAPPQPQPLKYPITTDRLVWSVVGAYYRGDLIGGELIADPRPGYYILASGERGPGRITDETPAREALGISEVEALARLESGEDGGSPELDDFERAIAAARLVLLAAAVTERPPGRPDGEQYTTVSQADYDRAVQAARMSGREA